MLTSVPINIGIEMSQPNEFDIACYILEKQGELEKAIETYNKAILLREV